MEEAPVTSPAQRTRESGPGRHRSGIVLRWLRGYDRAFLVPDVLAGLTAAAVVLPKAMAYAPVAGLPVQVGLYAALVPPIVYALIGRSPVLSVSTSATIGVLTGSTLAATVPGASPEQLIIARGARQVVERAPLAKAPGPPVHAPRPGSGRGAVPTPHGLRGFLIASHDLPISCAAQPPGQGRCLTQLSGPLRRPRPPASP
jgi:sulfate permease family protein